MPPDPVARLTALQSALEALADAIATKQAALRHARAELAALKAAAGAPSVPVVAPGSER
jgi:hypothetical protein